MREIERIPGAEEIWRQIPEWRGCWLYFDTILDFQIRRVSDFWEPPRYDGTLLVCDDAENYCIRLSMKNLCGKLSLDLAQKLSGLDIEDASYCRGYEKTVRFRIVDFENPDFSIYCEGLFVELVPLPRLGP